MAGDVEAGDLIALPDDVTPVLVKKVRVGRGGFILTVAPADDDRLERERFVTLSAKVSVRKYGRNPAF